jgi:hypothetical protein
MTTLKEWSKADLRRALLEAQDVALVLEQEGRSHSAWVVRSLGELLREASQALEDLGTKATNPTCCDPRFVKRDEKGEPIGWTITLNEYQRSNLLWLLCDVAGYDRQHPIVSGLQTGDWAGEIPNALRCHETDPNVPYEESKHRPNVSAAEAARWVSLYQKP